MAKSKVLNEMGLQAEQLRELVELRAETASWAAKLSEEEKKIAERLGVQEIQRMKEWTLTYKTEELRRKALDVIGQTENIQRELTQEMAAQFGWQKKALPYATEIADMTERLNAIRQNRSGLASGELSAMRATYDEQLTKLKGLQQEKIQLEKIQEITVGVEEAIGLQAGAIAGVGEKISKLIFNPWTAVLGLLALAVVKWKDIQQTADDFRKTTGLTVSQSKDITDSARQTAKELRPLGVGYEEAYKSAQALFETLGNTTLATKDNVKSVAELSARFGVAESDAAEFVKSMTLIGKGNVIGAMSKDLEVMAKSSGVSVSQVMKDIAESSESSYSFMSQNPKAFLKTAVEARKLGMSMKQISDITEGLLDIENSLGAEMEAQILSGKALNLDAARYYALIGDQGKALDSVLSQVTSLEEFNKMAPLSQKAYAAAVGMTRDEFAKTVMLRDKERKMTPAERAERERLAKIEDDIQGTMTKMQNSWRTIVSDVSSIMLPAMEAMEPIFKGIAWAVKGLHEFFVENKWVGYTLVGMGALLTLFLKMGTAVTAIKTSWSTVIGSFKGAAGWWSGKGMPIPTGITGGMKPQTPDIPSKGLGGLTTFMKEVKPQNMLAAGAAMIMIAGAVWILSKAMENFAKPDMWKGVLLGIGAMAALVAAVAILGAIMMSGVGTVAILAGAAAILIIAGAMWVLSDAMEKMAGSADGITKLLSALALADPAQILAVGGALASVGAGLGAMAIGGAAAGIVNTIFGNIPTGKPVAVKDKTDIVIEKLDKLIEVLEGKNFNVNLDGRRVSKQLGVATQYGT